MKPTNKIKVLFCIMLMVVEVRAYAQTVSQDQQAHRTIKAFIAEKYHPSGQTLILDGYQGYRATFKSSEGKYMVLFSLRNEWIQTERKVSFTDVPDTFRHSIANTKFSIAKILMVKEIMQPHDSLLYCIELRYTLPSDKNSIELADVRDYNLYYTAGGKLIKEEEGEEALKSIPWGQD